MRFRTARSRQGSDKVQASSGFNSILSWVRLSCIMQWVEVKVKVKVHLSWCVSLETDIKFN